MVIAFAYEPPALGAEMSDHRHALEDGEGPHRGGARPGRGSAVEATAAVVDARPADGLLALAAEHEAGMIVVGTYSERPSQGVVLGSTPYKLLHRSTVRCWWSGSPTPEPGRYQQAGRSFAQRYRRTEVL